MAQKKLLTNGKAFKRTDDRWGGTVWYMDEKWERKRKSFSGTTKAEVTKKMTNYVAAFNDALQESDESRKTLKESMTHWLQVFKFPSVERTTYDRCECTVEHQIFPLLGDKVVGDITAADLKEMLNHWMGEGYAYTTVKKVYIVLNEYFRYLTQQEILAKNPMNSVPMIKKSNFMAAQNKEDLPTRETVTVFTPEEIEKFKSEAFSTYSNGKPKYQQPAAYILMLNTGLRTGERLGLLNSDIDLEHKYLEVRQGVKEVCKRDGANFEPGREVKVGKTKTVTSKRRVPMNGAAEQAVEKTTPGTVFRAKFAPRERREGRLHQAGELPKEVLPDFESSGHRSERIAQFKTSFCDPTDKRRETARRHHQSTLAPSGGRPPRPQHLADN